MTLHLVEGVKAWKGYPAALNIPSSAWEGETLRAADVIDAVPDVKVLEDGAGVTRDGSTLRLCYRIARIPLKSGQPVPTSVSPIRLEFTVTGLPRRDYLLDVRSCA